MSLFRTLQNSPATVSIFHNAKLPASARLYKLLDKAYYELNDDKNQFQVDLMNNQMPTYDQFKLIYNQCLNDQASKSLLKSCFPFLSDKKQVVDLKAVTFKAPAVDNIKMFNEGEYQMIYEAFNSLVENPKADINPADIFSAPLVVDWDQNLIANNPESLQRILEKYGSVIDSLLSTA